DFRHVFRREVLVSLFDFLPRFGFKRVEQIVRLDALALSSGDFNVRALSVFRGEFNTELLGACRTQRHHLVRKMNGSAGFIFITERQDALANNGLQIRLPDIDDVVDGTAMAERWMDRFAVRGCGYPNMAIMIEHVVKEVLLEQTQFP